MVGDAAEANTKTESTRSQGSQRVRIEGTPPRDPLQNAKPAGDMITHLTLREAKPGSFRTGGFPTFLG